MPTTTQTLCYNCFQQVAAPAAPCPHCGFDLAENRQKFPVALQAGTVLNNRYIVGRVLGQGGFGITYVAFDTQLQARVAIKEYMPSDIATRVEGTTVSVMMDTKADDFTYGAERFQEEARTLAKFIGHPNIAGVSSYFDENGTSYFVMDYIEGVSFKSYIANNGGKVSVDETLNVMIPVLRALTAVHAEGFIHRDVTPDNIYISKDGNVKLLDFGSARYSIGDKSKSLDVILKVGYAPKEQYTRRGRQGPFTDVYSCAACFYAALTGYLPPESLDRLEHDTLTPVSQVMDIPEWLDKAILKGLAVQPEDRFQSAAEFLDAIENQLVVDVPVSGQAAPAQPAKKKLNPLVIGGAAAAIVVAVGLGAVLGGRGGGGTSADSSAPGTGGGGIIEALVPKVTIAGQEYSTAAVELDLSGAEMTEEDYRTLQEMKHLETLYISDAVLHDFTFLSGLPKLRNLGIGVAALDSLEGLDSLTELRTLELWMTNYSAPALLASDLTAFSNLTKLEELKADVCGLTSLHGIETLTNLRVAEFSGRGASYDNVEPLAGLTKLEVLKLPMHDGINGVSGTTLPKGVPFKIDALSNLTNLTDLTIEYYVTDLEPLRNLTNLQSLSVHNGSGYTMQNVKIFDSLEPLSGLTQLTSLELRMLDNMPTVNGAVDLSVLHNMPKLRNLDIIGWNIDDLTPLQNLTELRTLSITRLGNPEYLDLSPLQDLTNLSILDISNTLPDIDRSPVAHISNLNLH